MRIPNAALAVVIALGVTLPAAAQEQAKPGASAKLPFRISKQTTYITEPLTEAGLVDYATYLNRQMSRGVPPDNNAAVLYWQAIGKTENELYSSALFKNLAKELGVDPVSFKSYNKLKDELGTDPFDESGPHLVGLGAIAEQAGVKIDYSPASTLGAQYDLAQEHPWKSSEAPLVKKWLDSNRKPLELVLAASKRTHYYRPLVSENGYPTYLMTALLPDMQQYREIARLLSIRALLAMGESRPDDAIRDLLALHRVARHTAQGATPIEMLVGMALDSVAHGADRQLVNSHVATTGQLAEYARQLAKLPRLTDIQRVSQTDRFTELESLQTIAVEQISAKSPEDGLVDILMGEADSKTIHKLVSSYCEKGFDWNHVLIGFNDYYNQILEAFDRKSFAERRAALQKLENDVDGKLREIDSPSNLASSDGATRERRSEQITIILLKSMTVSPTTLLEGVTQSEARVVLSPVGVALAAYQASTGEFPKSLRALVPKYLPELPLDPYTGKQLVYRVDGQGALVYSLGQNLADDDGTSLAEDRENYDHVFRVTAK